MGHELWKLEGVPGDVDRAVENTLSVLVMSWPSSTTQKCPSLAPGKICRSPIGEAQRRQAM
jgi:hypothetical protein